MKNSSLDLFDPRTAVMDSDYLSEGGRDGDFGFAFNGSNFSDRTLQIEIIAESPETRSDGEGCQSLADWARNQKRQKEEVDVWSAGVILYILLCGVPPFWAETEQGVALTILRGVVDFKREPWPQISDNAKSLVQQMLEPDPRKRLTTKQVLAENMGAAFVASAADTVVVEAVAWK